jgi:hypothetical protein
VRGGDTHSAIGMYEKIAPLIDHDKIFYLITHNDYWENVETNEYINLTKRFGRRFDDRIIHIQNNWITELYLNIRVFVSEYFYFTTKLIRKIETITTFRNPPKYHITLEAKKEKILSTTPKMVSLLNNFERKILDKNNDIIVTTYPCVSYENAINWLPETCKVNEYLENNFHSSLRQANPNIHYWNSNKLIEGYVAKGCFEKRSLTFKNDRHFSPFGHYVFAQIIRKHLFNDVSYDKSVLC